MTMTKKQTLESWEEEATDILYNIEIFVLFKCSVLQLNKVKIHIHK